MRKNIVLFIALTLVLGVLPAAAQDDFSCPGAPPPRLTGSYQGRVTPGEPNNVRDEPSTAGNLAGTIPGEGIFYVYDGPVCADGYVWWQINYEDIYGWTVEGANGEYWVEPYPPVTVLEGNEIDYRGVAFTFDPALGSGVEARTYDAVEPTLDGPDWDVNPAYDEFRLVDYPGENAYFDPIITIYPAAEYAAMSEYAAEQIDAMKTLLANQPETQVDPDVPLIPIFNAGRVFQAQTQYVKFQNGAGFRFVTHYAQAIDVFTNKNVFFTYQGLTNDGMYWVSIFMPISAPVLPDDFDWEANSDFDWEAFSNQFMDYVAETTSNLNALPADQFTPDLTLLDSMIASLQVTGG
jgi:hypothetical protein